MEHHESWFTELLNHATGLHIPDHVAMSFLVMLLFGLFVLWLKPRLSAERPGAIQQVVEWLITNPLHVGIRDCIDQNIHHGRKYVALVGTVGIFVLLCNLISVIPGLTSPTGVPAGPLACALVTFVYFNARGAAHHGLWKYLKHFSGPGGPIGWMLIFPVELISTSARILSLTVRLWANIYASELIYLIILGMLVRPTQFALDHMPNILAVVSAPVAGIFAATLPVAFIGLHLFVAVVQSYVFTILPSVYLGMAVADEH
jgi:F-type H+-transporting ATPase subunit a